MIIRKNSSDGDNDRNEYNKELNRYNDLRDSVNPNAESMRIILIYLGIGGLWILLSDWIFMALTGDIEVYQRIQTYKGWFYVVFSGMMFYFIVRNSMELFKDATDQLYKGYEQLDISHEELFNAKNELQEKYNQLDYYRKALEESQMNYNLSVQGANDGVWSWDIKNDRYTTSIMTKTNFGYSQKEQEGINTMGKWQMLVHPEDLPIGKKTLEDYVLDDYDIYENIFRVKTAKEDYRWILSRGKLYRDDEGEPLRLAGSHTDLTEQLLLQENLHLEKELVESISNEAPIGILVSDKMGLIRKMNKYAEELLGYSERELLGRDAYKIFLNEQEKPELDKHLQLIFQGQTMSNVETRMITKFGKQKTVLWSNTFIHDINGEIDGLIFIGVDISERKEMEEKLERLAYYDPLTEMSNKEKFREDTNQLTNFKDGESGNSFTLVYLDIDDFKLVNDTMGHSAGDELLKHVGQTILTTLEEGEKAYRFGGDEYVIIMENLNHESVVSRMESLMERIRLPWEFNSQIFHISASAGIAMHPDHGNDFDQLMQNADTALSYAKDEGKNKFIVYDHGMSEKAWHHIQLSNDLRYAVERNEFELYYQPQIEIESNKVVGVEALIRWNHPVRGSVAPVDFIPFSEDTGQIDKIEEWVIETACRQSKLWYDYGYEDLSISINISGKMLGRGEWIDRIQKHISDCRKLGRIVFEITETSIISDLDLSLKSLKDIHGMGIRLALDDFGTGYSSLTYLQKLPIDIIKLDREFIWSIGMDEGREFIIEAVINLAHNLGMKVVAEGVETYEQSLFLKEAGCDYAQGYLYSKPLNIKDINILLDQINSRD